MNTAALSRSLPMVIGALITFEATWARFFAAPCHRCVGQSGGWTKSISDHLRNLFVGIYGELIPPGFLRWCEMDFATIRGMGLASIKMVNSLRRSSSSKAPVGIAE